MQQRGSYDLAPDREWLLCQPRDADHQQRHGDCQRSLLTQAIGGNRYSLLGTVILCTLFHGPSIALVGGAQRPPGNVVHQVVIIGDVHGRHCTGTALTRDIVLTAAHCVSETAGLIVQDGVNAESREVISVVLHPRYDAWSYAKSQATVDLALLKLTSPLPEPRPVMIPARVPLPGERFIVVGAGVMTSGSSAGLGTLQAAILTAIGEPSSLQLRLADPVSRSGTVAGLGSCDGDSGGPVFGWSGGRFVLVAVLTWSSGPNMSAGCGGITGATPLAHHRQWIVKTMREMGSRVNR